MQSNWTPKQSEALRGFLGKGISFSRIADAINARFKTSYSRNAVLGRARRMGLAASDRSNLPPAPSKTRVPRAQGTRVQEIQPDRRHRYACEFWPRPPVFETEAVELRCADVVPRHLSLIELQHPDCRYPYGGDVDGDIITFCGHRRQRGSSYCAAHFRLSIGPGAASERAVSLLSPRIVETA